MVVVQRPPLLDDEVIHELHPDWGSPDWVEWCPSAWDQGRGVLYFCSFCGQEVLDGYYNRRTDQYSCRVEGDYDAVMAYTAWLEETYSDEEEEEE